MLNITNINEKTRVRRARNNTNFFFFMRHNVVSVSALNIEKKINFSTLRYVYSTQDLSRSALQRK